MNAPLPQSPLPAACCAALPSALGSTLLVRYTVCIQQTVPEMKYNVLDFERIESNPNRQQTIRYGSGQTLLETRVHELAQASLHTQDSFNWPGVQIVSSGRGCAGVPLPLATMFDYHKPARDLRLHCTANGHGSEAPTTPPDSRSQTPRKSCDSPSGMSAAGCFMHHTAQLTSAPHTWIASTMWVGEGSPAPFTCRL